MQSMKRIHTAAKFILFAEKDGLLVSLLVHEKRWSFPGGKIEPGETEHSCILREVREECQSRLMDELIRQSVYMDDAKPVACFVRMVPYDHLRLCADSISRKVAIVPFGEIESMTEGFWKAPVLRGIVSAYFCPHRTLAYHECIYPDVEDLERVLPSKTHCSYVFGSPACVSICNENDRPIINRIRFLRETERFNEIVRGGL